MDKNELNDLRGDYSGSDRCPDCLCMLDLVVLPAHQSQGQIVNEQVTEIYSCPACGYETTDDYSKANN